MKQNTHNDEKNITTTPKNSINGGRQNLIDGIISPICFFLLSILIAIAIGSISLKIGQNVITSFLIPVASEITIILYILFKRKHYNREQVKDLLRLKNFKKKNILIALAIAIGFLIFSSIEQTIINNITHTHTMGSNTSKTIADTKGIIKILLLGVLTPFIAPVIEELFYRGLTMGLLENSNLTGKLNLLLPTTINSFFFALAHCQGFTTVNDYNVMAIVFILATLNSLFVRKTNSIYSSIMVHMFYNGIIAISAILITTN